MTFPNRRSRTLAARILLAFAGLALLTAIVGAEAQARTPRVNPGDGYELQAKPQTLSGWQVRDSTGTLQRPVMTGLKGNLNRPGAIRWKSWRKQKAVGLGLAWAQSCRVACPKAYPWDGSRVRVTAYRPRQGQFTRLRVFHWTAWGHPHANDENYSLKLKLIRRSSPRAFWKVVELDDGLARPLG